MFGTAVNPATAPLTVAVVNAAVAGVAVPIGVLSIVLLFIGPTILPLTLSTSSVLLSEKTDPVKKKAQPAMKKSQPDKKKAQPDMKKSQPAKKKAQPTKKKVETTGNKTQRGANKHGQANRTIKSKK